jgi:hypothetical protein
MSRPNARIANVRRAGSTADIHAPLTTCRGAAHRWSSVGAHGSFSAIIPTASGAFSLNNYLAWWRAGVATQRSWTRHWSTSGWNAVGAAAGGGVGHRHQRRHDTAPPAVSHWSGRHRGRSVAAVSLFTLIKSKPGRVGVATLSWTTRSSTSSQRASSCSTGVYRRSKMFLHSAGSRQTRSDDQ